MIRGAGSAMFEFQHRPRGVFASFPARPGDLRAVTEAYRTYEVPAGDLLEAFSLHEGPGEDLRIGRPYEPMEYTWPDWATDR